MTSKPFNESQNHQSPAGQRLDQRHREQLSALVDGELGADEARFLLRRMEHDPELAGCQERWQLLGDVMRGQASALAHAVFDHVGGSDWSYSRQFIYTRERGEIGQLALAVAKSADADGEARAILQQAGRELARLARALVARFGPRPIVLSGRAAGLHPLIAQAMREDLPAALAFEQRTARPHAAAARLAARDND